MIILLQCSDAVGLVAAVSSTIANENLNIVSMREFVNTDENRFFLRLEVEQNFNDDHIKRRLTEVLPADAQIFISASTPKKIVALVTKEFHCIGDMLLRNFFHTLGADLKAVIGNYNYLQPLCEKFDVEYYHISHEMKSKADFENEVMNIIDKLDFDYIVLAKFMRILSPAFVEKYKHQIINIHHSFLPAFIGANPYAQAHTRGVKMIGATAHFVTNDLDEGPIIAQQIIPVNHAFSVKDMREAGKEIEKSVLMKALKLVFEDRVIVSGNKTIVFE